MIIPKLSHKQYLALYYLSIASTPNVVLFTKVGSYFSPYTLLKNKYIERTNLHGRLVYHITREGKQELEKAKQFYKMMKYD